MGGADDARRHAFQRFRRHAGARANRARALPRDIAKRTPERPQALPAGLESNFDDGHLGVPKQRHCTLDASSEQVTVRRHSECLLERTREMRLRDATDLCQPRDRPGFVRGAVHSILRAQQATQDFRVLRRSHWRRAHWNNVNRIPATNKLPKICLLYRASHNGR